VLNFINGHKLRLALALALIAILFVAPILTSAQYKWKINGYTVVQAQEFYFESNYLHDESKSSFYHTTGWDGVKDVVQKIEIRNFENSLLTNKQGENAEYEIDWEISTFIAIEQPDGTFKYRPATGSEQYTIKHVAKNTTEKIITGINYCTGTLVGDGTPHKDDYQFYLNSPTGGAIPWNSYVRITMHSKNVKFSRDENGDIIYDPITGMAQYEETDSFQREISATFEYVLTSTQGFITRFDPVDKTGYKDLVLYIGTGTSPSSSGLSQSVTVWWDNTKLAVNPFNITFATMIAKETDTIKYYHAVYSEALPGISSLTITELGSNATRTLDFYKEDNINIVYWEMDHWKTKTENWFYEDSNPPEGQTGTINTKDILVVTNKTPEAALTDGSQAILGYYVEEASH